MLCFSKNLKHFHFRRSFKFEFISINLCVVNETCKTCLDSIQPFLSYNLRIMSVYCAKEFSIPDGFSEILRSLTSEILLHQPDDIYEFALKHFKKKIEERNRSRKEMGSTTRPKGGNNKHSPSA
mmetsp:Transcript_2867/g.4085  ORF Transcript_2867/g.4085 Transcript_2867/m.4085 type:complete len:124 (-) Transcript_2867:1877-2248(-)